MHRPKGARPACPGVVRGVNVSAEFTFAVYLQYGDSICLYIYDMGYGCDWKAIWDLLIYFLYFVSYIVACK